MMDFHTYNAKNHYGLNLKQLKYWAKRHKQAKEKNDIKTVQWIENMLTDINFHYERGLFAQGEYEKAIKDFQIK